MSTLTTSRTSRNSLKIALLNTIPLNKHGVNIAKDNRLLQTDILCLTHVIPCHYLDQFHFYHNKSTDKFESLTFACTNYVDVVSHHQIPGKLFFSFRKLTLKEGQLNILLLYCKITTNLAGFYEHLREINFSQNIDLLLGDFNINVLDPTSPILQVMSSYVQVMTEFTQILGALLDHVFFQKDLLKNLKLKVLLEHYPLMIMILSC